MVKIVGAVVLQCTYLVLTSFEGFNMHIMQTAVICRFCIQNNLTWMMFSVGSKIDSWQFVVAVAD
jgi:hypothetical protein